MATGTRPGGRSARVRKAVFEATLAEVTERGYTDVSVERIATRAQVNKTTIYRRWSDLDGLLADVLLASSEAHAPIPDTGQLHQDLRELAHGVAAAMGDPGIGALVRGLAAAAARNARSATVLAEFLAIRQRSGTALIERAVDRGELPAHTDRRSLLKSLVAPIFLHLLVTGEPIDAELANRASSATYAAAQAGVFNGITHAPS